MSHPASRASGAETHRLLAEGLDALGLPAGDMTALLSGYLDEVQRWSGSFNLVSFRDRRELVLRHVLDSLAVQPWCSEAELLDVGSGAGLPGIPLAIANPARHVTLLDANGKKVRFLRHVRRTLPLENIHPLQSRAEAFVPPAPFDQVISRAFSRLADYVRAVRHLVSPGGRVLAMKGQRPGDEIRDLPAWVRVESVEPIRVPHLQAERHLVIMAVTPE